MSNLAMDRDPSRTGLMMPSRLRRITSLPGWPRERIPRESAVQSAAPQDGEDVSRTTNRISSKTNLRRIASTPGRIFRSNIGADTTHQKETSSEDSLVKVTSKSMTQVTRRPSVIRLRRMASMPARSLKRMTSRPQVPSSGATTSEGRYLSRMRSWSGSVKTGTSRWFGTVRQLPIYVYFLKTTTTKGSN